MPRERWKILAAFAAVYIIWGSTYLAILIGIQTIPPLLMAALRFLAAGITLFVWRLFKGDKIPSGRSLLQNSLVGILTLAGGIGTVGWSEQYISSSLAAIIVTAVPFWFVLFDRNQWSFYFSNKMILTGLLLGFAGVAILVGFSHQGQAGSNNQLIGSLVIICGGIAWTTGSLYSKYRMKGHSLLMDAGVQFLIAGLFSMGISRMLGEWRNFQLENVSTRSWLALGYLFTMGSLVAYLAYLWLIKNRPPAQVSSYVYVNPVIALLLGALVAHEKIGWAQMLGLATILCGVVMVNIPKYSKQLADH
jgi:drug/metabolite transporter (DMT)-like permease